MSAGANDGVRDAAAAASSPIVASQARPETVPHGPERTSTPTQRPPRMPLIARTHEDHAEHRQATWLELFFDLCFVVAIAALARAFHSDPTWPGALIYIGLFLPVWWAWMGYSWFANSFDNDDVPYRAVVFGAMLSVLWLAASVDAAARGATDAYALAYIALSVLLLSLLIRARRDSRKHPEDRWQRVVSGFLTRYIALQTLGIGLWIASFAFEEPTRYVLWGVGLAAQLCGPFAGIRPFWEDDHTHDRIFHFDHIRERYGLLTIIVLGESVLAVSLGKLDFDATTMATAALAFLVAVSIWWTYFDRSGRDALSGNLSVAFIWGYGHFAIFAGIAAVGVGAQLVIEAAAKSEAVVLAATEPVAGAAAGPGAGPAVFAGGLVAFLAGMTLINLSNLGFRITPIGRIGLSLRFTVAVGIVAVAWLLTPSPLVFASVAGISMLSLNAIEATLVMRLRQRQTDTAAAGS